jgi:membrane-associated phospholipid phosphatase
MFWQGIATPTSTPPGLWNKIAQEAAVAQGNTLVQNARMFALLDLTLADTAIACWDAKYTYNFWRPVTAVRAADTDGNPDTEADPNWTPLLATPSHPSYPSAHATELGGSAEILASFFGTDAIPFSISWEGLPGVTRSYAGFSAAADEATMSRIWAGFHWSFDLTAGHTLGLSVADYVFQNYLQPVATPPPGGGAAPIHAPIHGGPRGLILGQASGINSASGAASARRSDAGEALVALGPVGEIILNPAPVDSAGNSAVSDPRAAEAAQAVLSTGQRGRTVPARIDAFFHQFAAASDNRDGSSTHRLGRIDRLAEAGEEAISLSDAT